MPHSFSNWNQSAHSLPAAVAIPRSVEELVEIIVNESTYPSPVLAAGHFHSMNACFETTGTQVLMQHFNDMRVDLEAGTITVGAYVKMIQIRDELRRHGMQTEVMPEIGSASAGYVACYGTKDASLGSKPLLRLHVLGDSAQPVGAEQRDRASDAWGRMAPFPGSQAAR